MKKVFNILCIVMLAICITGCNNKNEEAANNQPVIGGNTPNPMVEYGSLDEINGVAKTKLFHPAIPGVSDEKFFVVSDTLAHYAFSANGIDYVFRGSKNINEDISGVWIGDATAFENSTENYDIVISENAKCAKMLIKDTLYVLIANDKGSLSEEQFNNIADEFHNILLTNASNESVNALVGDYMDRISQRAIAHVKLVEVDTVAIDIHWGNSVESHEEWQIIAKYENGRLVYEMGQINHLHYDGDAAVQVNDAVSGYFEIEDDVVAWSGSNIDSTSSCEFEKVELVSDSKK